MADEIYERLYRRSVFPIVAAMGKTTWRCQDVFWARAAWGGAGIRTFLATLAIIVWEAAWAADQALSRRFWRQRWAVEAAVRSWQRKLTGAGITLEDFDRPWYAPLD